MRTLFLLLSATSSLACTGANGGGSTPLPGGGSGSPVLLAQAEVPASLAVHGNNVVWTDVHWDQTVRTSVVNRVPKSGGTITRIAEHGGDDVFFLGITADETNVHWVGYGQVAKGALFTTPTSGLEPTVVAPNLDFPVAITRTAQSLFWINLSPGGAMSLSPSSPTPVALAADPQDSSSCIAVAGENIVWLSHSDTPRISRVSAQGGPLAIVTQGSTGGAIQCLAADAEFVYFTRYGTSTTEFEPVYNHDGAVYRVPINGGTPIVLAASQERPHGIALRDTHVYWLNGDGAVRSVPKSGGAIDTLVPADGSNSAFRTQSLVADASGLYWISKNAIWGLSLP